MWDDEGQILILGDASKQNYRVSHLTLVITDHQFYIVLLAFLSRSKLLSVIPYLAVCCHH